MAKVGLSTVDSSLQSVSADRKLYALSNNLGGRKVQVNLWDTSCNKCTATLSLENEVVTSMSFASLQKKEQKASASFLFLGTMSGKLHVYDINTGNLALSSHSYGAPVTCMTNVDDRMVVGTKRGEVMVTRLKMDGSMSEEASFKTKAKNEVSSLAAWGNTLAVGQESIYIYDLSYKKLLKTLAGHSSGQVNMLLKCGSRLISSANLDTTVFVWDIELDRNDPIFSINLPLPPSQIDLSSAFDLSIVCEKKCSIFSGLNGEPKKKVSSLKSKSEFYFSTEQIVDCYFEENKNNMLTIRGTPNIPIFENLVFKDEDNQYISGVLNREPVFRMADESKAKNQENPNKKPRTGPIEVISGASVPVRHNPDSQLQETTVLSDEIVVHQEEGLKTVTNLLIQALQSRNPQLIESALALRDEDIIIESLGKLPQPITIILLEELVLRVTKKPARVVQLGPWIRCLHAIHLDYLKTLNNYHSVMRPLQDTISLHTESRDLLDSLSTSVEAAKAKRATFDELGDVLVKKADNYFVYEDIESKPSLDDDNDDSSIPDIVDFSVKKPEEESEQSESEAESDT
jgi:hypothetical protein